jgi:Xaa-Pro aminopeptidase
MRIIYYLLFFVSFTSFSQQILPERQRAEVIDKLLKERFEHLLPQLMDDTGFDMWILISREYNEDPVLKTMLPATWLNARRRTILVFYRNKKENSIEKLAVARYNFGENIQSAWDKEKEPDQWKRLMQIIEERRPQKIGLNYSTYFNICDGIVKTDYEAFMANLPKRYRSRVTSAEQLAIRWIETRTEAEMILYNQLVDITHDIISEAFSEKVITPGVTTTSDVQWWMRDKIRSLGLTTWFHPTVDVQRSAETTAKQLYAFSDRPENMVILPGDLLHCDVGITYLRLNTDCQQLAYVLRPGESSAPDFLVNAFKDGNRVQDIFTNNFKTGKTGNEILKSSLDQARAEGLKPAIYTHPLGTYGHSAGTTLGMWDAQNGVPVTGDYPLRENTVYAIELNTTVNVSEWNREIRVMLEEAGFWGPDGFRYVNGRQTGFLLVPRQKPHRGH